MLGDYKVPQPRSIKGETLPVCQYSTTLWEGNRDLMLSAITVSMLNSTYLGLLK